MNDNAKNLIYEENDDFGELRNTNYNPNNYKDSNIQDFLEKESSEPDITYFLNAEPESKEGAEVLRKCINYFYEKKWEALISFLEIGGKKLFLKK